MVTGNNDEDEHATDSSSDSNSDFPTRKRRKSKKRKKRLALHKDEASAANIAVLNISCWILRIPVLYMDFIGCVYSSACVCATPTVRKQPYRHVHPAIS